jgi:predicted ATPase/DNA-binding CsgD family transcriptional regulator
VPKRLQRGNLPAEVSSFAGRERELAQVRLLLGAAESGLVTLTGAGGVGKTRLAIRAARAAKRAFPEGVWLVELAALEDEALLGATVAEVLGVGSRSATAPVAVLASYLEDKRLILVLDNCEHLASGCAVLVSKLLAHAPGLRVLATSRQPLDCEGERVLVVPPLPLPDPSRLALDRDLGDYPAARLFTDRARAVDQGFTITDANRAPVAELLQRLDGIPLAIELAAARTRVLTPAQILARLDDPFRLLSSGPRTGPARHRTLRATVDWSHQLCSDDEQGLWARTAVFAGGFDLNAAEQVGSGDGIAPDQVFALIAGLVDKSVLTRSHHGSVARYSMLEPIRQYGRDQLRSAGQEGATRNRHRDYYLGLLEQAEADLFSPRQAQWFNRLEGDLANLRLALDFSLTPSDRPDRAHIGLRMAVALRLLWTTSGRPLEGHRWLARALAFDRDPSPARARALSLCGHELANLGRLDEALALAAEGRALGERLNDPTAVAFAAQASGMALLFRSQYDAAVAQLEAARAGYRSVGNLFYLCNTLFTLTTATSLAGNPRAGDYGEEALAVSEAHGAEWSHAWALATLALHRWLQGQGPEAVALLRQALALRRLSHEVSHEAWGTGFALEILAWAMTGTGQPERAGTLLGACHSIWRSAGVSMAERGPIKAHHDRCEQQARATLGTDRYAEAFARGTRLTTAEAISYALGEAPVTSGGAAVPSTALTRREREIAPLVAEGLTDRQIAARLVLSERTVSTHVGHILAKRGFTSRTQIAAWVTAQRARRQQ